MIVLLELDQLNNVDNNNYFCSINNNNKKNNNDDTLTNYFRYIAYHFVSHVLN